LFFPSLSKFTHLHIIITINTTTPNRNTEPKTNMPIPRIYPHYPKPNPTPSTAFEFATTNDEHKQGPPKKKMAIIETEPILTEDLYPAHGVRLIKSSYMYSNKKAWDFVAWIKMSAWEHSVVDVSNDFLDSMDASSDARKTLTTIMCDHGTKQGTMSKNIMNNFAREVTKPIQL
jgi:hypothetical protein